MIALYDPITPMIQIGLAALGLIILVSAALGWRVAKGKDEEWPDERGDDLRDMATRIRSKRDRPPGPPS